MSLVAGAFCYALAVYLAFNMIIFVFMGPRWIYEPSDEWKRVGNMTAEEKRALAVAQFPKIFRESGPSLADVVRVINRDPCFSIGYIFLSPEDMVACDELWKHLETLRL